VRKARFFQHDSYVSIDYAEQEVEAYRLVSEDGARPAIRGGPIAVTRNEPLRLELEDFVDAVRVNRPPAVTGRDGRAALALATQVSELISKGTA
jgi:predicted dehydrogenase